MARVSEQVAVAFAGDGEGTGELSWGQYENWTAIVRQKTWIPLGGIKPLDPGTTVAGIAAELSYLMGRYQSLRTRLRYDASGHPTQIVAGSGEITLTIVDTVAGDDPAAVAEEIRADYERTDLDFTREWPVRMALVRHDGVLTHMVVLMSHFVTDAAGSIVMMSDVATLNPAPVTGMAPLEQARWQRSRAGQRQNDGALRYWEGILRAAGQRRFVEQPDPVRPRYWHGEFRSPAMAPAIRTIAERAGLESTSVLMGIFAMALAPVTGINPVLVRPMVSNRFRADLASVVCTLAQAGLCSIDVLGVPFEEALSRVQRSAMSAYKYGYFHPRDLTDLRERIAKERGFDVELGCYFNDRRSSRTIPAGPTPTTADLDDARSRTTFRWLASQDAPAFEQLFVHVDDVPDMIAMTIHLDTHALPPADGEAVLRGMERIALEAAFDPATAARA